MGNREIVDDGSQTSYSANNLNQYTSVGGTNYSYDGNGNLTNDGAYKYYYDCENHLTDVNDINDQKVASYVYDFKGRRIAKTVYGDTDVTTKYCYDGDEVIAEYEGDTLVRKFIYGPVIDEPIVMIDVTDSDKYYYYHFDGLGSVVALSDDNADIVEKYTYDVFGECTVHGPGADGNWGTGDDITDANSLYDNPYLFTARRQDPETVLYYYRARMYNPRIGRFMQTDPVGYSAGLNLYTYCVNNPLNGIDPYGLDKDNWNRFENWIKSFWEAGKYSVPGGGAVGAGEGAFGIVDISVGDAQKRAQGNYQTRGNIDAHRPTHYIYTPQGGFRYIGSDPNYSWVWETNAGDEYNVKW